MRTSSLLVTLLLIAASGAAYGRGTAKDFVIPLKFVPQEGVHSSTADLPTGVTEKFVEIRLSDARRTDDRLIIGQATGGDDKPFPVRSTDDPVPFIKAALTQVVTDWGVRDQPPAVRILAIGVTRYFVDESNKALGSMYAAEVKLTFVLQDAAGMPLAEGSVSGSAHRYGRAHSPDNVNEVLSDALKEAIANVMADPSLQSSWASGKRAAGSAPQVAPDLKETVEERLRKLDDLLKKGLISKPEYDRKRAEILKEL